MLLDASRAAIARFQAAFLEGLGEHGWVEGKNLVIERRFAEGDLARLAPLAKELVALAPDLILAPTTSGASAVRKLTAKIPIVFVLGADPVGIGLAETLARPGGNVTGFNLISADIAVKRLEILREMLPSIARIAVLNQPRREANTAALIPMRRAAGAMGLALDLIEIGAPDTFDAAFERLGALRPDAAYVLASPASYIHRQEIVRRVAAARVPAIYGARAFAEAGGLMSYAVDFVDNFRRAAGYVDRILRGAPPGELPIQQPTKFEFVINLKTARALGVSIPQMVLLRADRVIE